MNKSPKELFAYFTRDSYEDDPNLRFKEIRHGRALVMIVSMLEEIYQSLEELKKRGINEPGENNR
jgi:hypothetical protein